MPPALVLVLLELLVFAPPALLVFAPPALLLVPPAALPPAASAPPESPPPTSAPPDSSPPEFLLELDLVPPVPLFVAFALEPPCPVFVVFAVPPVFFVAELDWLALVPPLALPPASAEPPYSSLFEEEHPKVLANAKHVTSPIISLEDSPEPILIVIGWPLPGIRCPKETGILIKGLAAALGFAC